MAEGQFQDGKVLMIVLDCAEIRLVDHWCDEGVMPNLQKLRQRGAFGPMGSTAGTLIATPWPTLITSQWPVEHGFTCWMQWRPDEQEEKRCDASWVPLNPFYRRLGPLGKRVVALDVPMAYDPEPMEGIELASWASYDKLCDLSSYPPEFLDGIQKKYHKQPIGPELGELQSMKNMLKLRDNLISGTKIAGDAYRDTLQQEQWDLALCCFGAPHRVGHNFWSHASFKEPESEVSAADLEKFDHTIRDVYVAADEQIGKLLADLPEDVSVFCFATHGMGPTQSRFEVVHEMLDRILHDRKDMPEERWVPQPSLLKRVRNSIPTQWRLKAKQLLSKSLQDKLMKFWGGKAGVDWSQVVAFVPAGDLEGYVRINLKGRERDGIVEPDQYEPLMQKIIEGFMSFKDEQTGQPLVEAVLRGDELWPDVPEERRWPIADLVVRWSTLPSMDSQTMMSETYGRIFWPLQDKVPDGRSGHHRESGWMVAAGPGIAPGSSIDDIHIMDIAPTVMHRMGLEPFETFRGRVQSFQSQVAPAAEVAAG